MGAPPSASPTGASTTYSRLHGNSLCMGGQLLTIASRLAFVLSLQAPRWCKTSRTPRTRRACSRFSCQKSVATRLLTLGGERSSPVRLVMAVIHEGAVARAAERAGQPRMLAKVCSLRPTPGPDALPRALGSALVNASSAVEDDKSHRQNHCTATSPFYKTLLLSSSNCSSWGKPALTSTQKLWKQVSKKASASGLVRSKQTLQTVPATIRQPCHRPASNIEDEPRTSPTLLPDSSQKDELQPSISLSWKKAAPVQSLEFLVCQGIPALGSLDSETAQRPL